MNLRGMSLRYKILTALTVLPLVGLLIFLLIAVQIFEKDKIAYIFDSSLSVSKTKAQRVRSEVSSLISVSQAIVYSFTPDTRTLTESGTYYFEQEPKFEALKLFVMNPELGTYEEVVDLKKEGETVGTTKDQVQKILGDVSKETVALEKSADPQSSSVVLGIRFGEQADPKHVVAIATFQAVEIEQAFSTEGAFASFLIRRDGNAIFGKGVKLKDGQSWWEASTIYKALKIDRIPEGIAELKSPRGEAYLASFSSVGVGDIFVVSMVDQTKALGAVNTLLRKAILFFLAVLSVTTIISVLASSRMTQALRYLLMATKKITEGQFDVQVEVKSKDEIGLLATSFNKMAVEVSRLMLETADKARMEGELATAKTVQETLFPENNAALGPVEISGHYQPASECGGDWWYYCEHGDRVYLWIGDATGHGAPAALITSAARAVASCIQSGPAIEPSQAMAMLNRAIHDSSKGRMMMTFFLATIDKNTGVMQYANASHEAPLLLRKPASEPSRQDFEPLNDINNPRLGERADVTFKQSSVQLEPGDQIVFYTDGVTDLKDQEKKSWGERRFLKSLAKELYENEKPSAALIGVTTSLYEFRNDAPLDDDVTLILCKYKGAA